MPRKSSVHFKPVSNVRFSVSHSERTDLSEPSYLLPKEHQMDNVIVAGSLSENELSALFIQQQEGMSRQAKTAKASPFWEGVVVLANTNAQEQSANLLEWKKAYEQATGHKVLHMSVHLDEGYVDATGHPQYNPHAHVIVSRMDGKNKVIHLDRTKLAKVQDLTAENLKMQRGSTLEERQGKRGRKHVGHREYRAQAEESRLDLDKEKGKTALEGRLTDSLSATLAGTRIKLKEAQTEAAKVPQLEAMVSTQATEIARLNELYRLSRQALKDSGEAKQADYQALKKAHEEALVKLKSQDLVIGNLLKNEAVVHGKLTAVVQENTTLKAENAKLAADLAQENPALFVPGKPAPLPSIQNNPAKPVALKTAKTPAEAPKTKSLPTPLPMPEKTLRERLEASFKAFVDWIKGKDGVLVEVDTQHSDHYGSVVQLDDLHAVQRTAPGKFAIHELAKLDRVPALDDPKMEIKYRGGVGRVVGKLGIGKGRAD